MKIIEEMTVTVAIVVVMIIITVDGCLSMKFWGFVIVMVRTVSTIKIRRESLASYFIKTYEWYRS